MELIKNAAYKIFKNNLFFGVGLKNFREESKRKFIKMMNLKKQMQDKLLIHIKYILNYYPKLDYWDI